MTTVRHATAQDAAVVAGLLHDFNTEYATPSPGAAVLTGRLERLLAGPSVFALLTGDPATGLALVSVRPNVWYDGSVGLLDELYVVPGLRGRGQGTALLHAAEAEVRSRGGELLEINVDGDDVDTRRFYERHGYRNSEPGSEEQLLYYFRELPREGASS
jgi:GNAT superfamily N-acetyltransferase